MTVVFELHVKGAVQVAQCACGERREFKRNRLGYGPSDMFDWFDRHAKCPDASDAPEARQVRARDAASARVARRP